MTSFGPYLANNVFSSTEPDTSAVRLYHGESNSYLQNKLGEVEPIEGKATFSELNIDPDLLRFFYVDYGPAGQRQFFTDYRHAYDEGDFDHISEVTFDVVTNEVTGELVE